MLKLKQEVPVSHSIWKRSDDADGTLQDCLTSTDWNMLLDSSHGNEEYNTSVLSFINMCIGAIRPTVTVRTYPNQKPWITGNIHTELMARAAYFKERNTNQDTYKKCRYALRRLNPSLKLVGCDRACKLFWTTKGRAVQWRKPTRWAYCLLCSLRGKQHWNMHERTSCSGWLCDNAFGSRCELDL